MEVLLVLGVPFAGGIVLAIWGHRAFAPELNSGMSLATFAAAAVLTGRIIADLIAGRNPACDVGPFSPARFQ